MERQDGKYLTFAMGDEEYGIPILKVKEIIGLMEITQIPKTPHFIKGVINLRGKIIPIMDLRLKFGLEAMPYNDRTCIIVAEIDRGETKKPMGIVVDTVSEVVNILGDQIDPPPQYGIQIDESFLMGMGKVKEKVIMLLNVDEVLNKKEFAVLNNLKGSGVNV